MIDCFNCAEIWADLKILSKRFRDPQFEPRAESVSSDPFEDPDIPYLQAVQQYAQSLILGCSASRDNLFRLARHAEPPGWETYKIRYALPRIGKSAGARVVFQWNKEREQMLFVAIRQKRDVEDQEAFEKLCKLRIARFHNP